MFRGHGRDCGRESLVGEGMGVGVGVDWGQGEAEGGARGEE